MDQTAPSTLSAPSGGLGRCPQHPASPISRRCDGCGVAMCAVCEFHFPISTYVCPLCVVAPRVVSLRRQQLAGAGLAMTVVSMVCVSIAINTQVTTDNALNLIALIVLPAAIGLTLSLSVLDTNRGNNALLLASSIVSSLWVAFAFGCSVVAVHRVSTAMEGIDDDDAPTPHHRPLPPGGPPPGF